MRYVRVSGYKEAPSSLRWYLCLLAALLLAFVLILVTPPPHSDAARRIEMTLTAYAPLDPLSKEGMCWSGSRYSTASGRRPEPWVTVAMDRKVVPLGSWVHIEGYGTFRVDDTGVKGNRIDLCAWTVKGAIEKIGKKKVWVWVP